MDNYKKNELRDLEYKIFVEMDIKFCNEILNNLIKKKFNILSHF